MEKPGRKNQKHLPAFKICVITNRHKHPKPLGNVGKPKYIPGSTIYKRYKEVGMKTEEKRKKQIQKLFKPQFSLPGCFLNINFTAPLYACKFNIGKYSFLFQIPHRLPICLSTHREYFIEIPKNINFFYIKKEKKAKSY